MKKLLLITILSFFPALGWCGASVTGSTLFGDIDMGAVNDVANGSMSVGGWIKLTEDAGVDAVIGKKANITAGTTGYLIYEDSADNLHAIAADGTSQKTCDSTQDLDGTWVHVIMTFNGANDNTLLYENGVAACIAAGGSLNTLTNSIAGITFKMGNTNSGPVGAPLNGNMAYGFFVNSVLAQYQRAELQIKPDLITTTVNHSSWYLTGETSTAKDYGTTNFVGTITSFNSDGDGPPIMFGQGLPFGG